MSRHKCYRATSYQPLITRFDPKGAKHDEVISLIPEEIEALYLMDLLDLYQEEAALKMEVSRPTFARIIKTARHKVALALLGGHRLHLEVKRERYVVAFCSNDKTHFEELNTKDKYLCIFNVENHRIVKTLFLENPAHEKEAKPPLVLAPLLQEHQVNFFLTKTLGQGFRNALGARGIQVIEKESIEANEISKLF
ncbi:MAG: DUF134 domain-containing protein [Campylobacterales bacterium]|nr:DUF134 domain-containing protein [Campylobacterales bacterium]MBN2833185.1 DUF134 domain-containing protein [Campylobacterales bacterium]